MWTIIVLIAVIGVVALSTLFSSTQRVKTSSDYSLCQRAINNAEAGAERLINAMKNTPDTNGDGIYDDAPSSITDTWGTKIHDIDADGVSDFYQLFGQNKNIPDIVDVDKDDAIELFITSDEEAYVWAEASEPGPNRATIYSRSTAGRCTKTVKLIISAVAGSTGSGITSPLFNAVP